MEKYKIKRNPKKLTDEQIDSHKDFSKLLSNQQKLHRYKDGTRPMYRNIGFMCMMAVIGIVLLMLVLDNAEESGSIAAMETLPVVKADSGLQIPIDQSQTPVTETIPANEAEKNTTSEKPVQPVTPAIVYEVFTLDPNLGGVLYTQSGARLLVPAAAFSNKSNALVKKTITLKFRELPSLKEEGVRKEPSFAPSRSFELLSSESASNTAVMLSTPIVIEVVSTIQQGQGNLFAYSKEKDNWELSGKEKSSYRFNIQSNDTQFPELAMLRQMAWEMPDEANYTKLRYVFNRSWKGFTYKTIDKKESSVKNTNSSVNLLTDLAQILAEPKQDQALKEAYFTLYNVSLGKNTDVESQKKALETIETWKNSTEGKEYQKWLKNEAFENQFHANSKISKFSIQRSGIHSISYISNIQIASNNSKRVLTLDKYPEKTQQYNKEMNQD